MCNRPDEFVMHHGKSLNVIENQIKDRRLQIHNNMERYLVDFELECARRQRVEGLRLVFLSTQLKKQKPTSKRMLDCRQESRNYGSQQVIVGNGDTHVNSTRLFVRPKGKS